MVDSVLSRYLQPSALIPTDGIVKSTAQQAVRGATAELDKARAIYEWIVDNTFRDPKVKGCGRGDIRYMLESKNMGGNCADINALYVGMARAIGLPARDVYGLRLVKSEKGSGNAPDRVGSTRAAPRGVALARMAREGPPEGGPSTTWRRSR